MSRLREEAWRLDLPRYRLRCDMRAAYGDTGSFRHLDTVTPARCLEEGRAALDMPRAIPAEVRALPSDCAVPA